MSQPTILIIEDDLIVAENAREHLHSVGYPNIHTAKDYDEALAISKLVKPDVFLVDIILERSKLNGIEIMESVFGQSKSPIIYITGTLDHEYREKAKQTNPSAFLIKPIHMTQLEVAVDFALNSRRETLDHQTAMIDHCPFISGPSYFFIKAGTKYEKILKSDIQILKSDSTYTDIVTPHKVYTYYKTLKTLLERLEYKDIVRCHNSYAVNLKHVVAFDNDNLVIRTDTEHRNIPIGTVYKSDVMAMLPRL